MFTRVTRSSKLVKTSADSLQSSPFPTISTGSIEKPSGVTSSPPHVSKQLKEPDLTSVRPKRMRTLATLGKKLRDRTKNKEGKSKQSKTKRKRVRILKGKYTSQNPQAYLCIYYFLHSS